MSDCYIRSILKKIVKLYGYISLKGVILFTLLKWRHHDMNK